MFDTLSDRLAATFKNLRGKGKLSDSDIDATAKEIRIALLEADVALPVVRAFINAVKERARSSEVSGALNPAQQVVKIVNEELIRILGGQTRRLRFAKVSPTVIMLAGLQGSGKTTLAGKLARWLKEQGHAPMLVACDLQRPNAVQQLQIVGERVGVYVYAPEPGSGVGNPVQVARASIEEARRRQHDIVIVDTAGRLGIDAEMMKQAADIRDAVSPDEVLFVVDAMIGQDAVTTAQAFLDGDARGGAALSVAQVTGRQIMFASAGEKPEDFDLFHPDRMASRILGMGDMLTLIEKAEKAFDEKQAAEMAEKLLGRKGKKGKGGTGEFTLDDFMAQMESVKKMGSLGKLLQMLPGMGDIKEQLNQVDDRDMDRIVGIIRGMTPDERRDPKIINGSRRKRIADGSGVTVAEVNSLVERFFEARKMMQSMAGGAMPNIPGMGPMPGGRVSSKKSKGKQQASRQRGVRSGNPALRARQAREAEERRAAAADGTAPNGTNPDDWELPPGFGDLLPPGR